MTHKFNINPKTKCTCRIGL